MKRTATAQSTPDDRHPAQIWFKRIFDRAIARRTIVDSGYKVLRTNAKPPQNWQIRYIDQVLFEVGEALTPEDPESLAEVVMECEHFYMVWREPGARLVPAAAGLEAVSHYMEFNRPDQPPTIHVLTLDPNAPYCLAHELGHFLYGIGQVADRPASQRLIEAAQKSMRLVDEDGAPLPDVVLDYLADPTEVWARLVEMQVADYYGESNRYTAIVYWPEELRRIPGYWSESAWHKLVARTQKATLAALEQGFQQVGWLETGYGDWLEKTADFNPEA